MRYFKPYYKNSAEELLTYYPRYYDEVAEMRAIIAADGYVLDNVEAAIERVFKNGFILEADADTLREWENILDITYNPQLTLKQRRAAIIARLAAIGHIGEQEIRGMVSGYTPERVDVDFDAGIVGVVIEERFDGEMELLGTLRKKIPAHLQINMRINLPRAPELPLYFAGNLVTWYTMPLEFPREATMVDSEYTGVGFGRFETVTLAERPFRANAHKIEYVGGALKVTPKSILKLG